MSSSRTLNPSAIETDRAARLSLQSARSYSFPGGPLACDLGTVNVLKLAEVERGGEHDHER